MNVVTRNRRDTADDALIRVLYEEHAGALLGYATRLTGNRMAAEDLVQETLLRAWRHREELALGTRPVRAWLITVVRNLATDRARAAAARPTEVAETPHRPPVQGDHAEDVVGAADMLDVLRSLSDKHRAVLYELYYNDRTATEAADALGIPVGTVKSRAHHALRALRAHLDELGVTELAARGWGSGGVDRPAERIGRPAGPVRPAVGC
jgi:RNA polymerase sigma-70 factor, ECF subfamily